jgi:peptidoglycan/LPS O-acetylase OafA/YrhL
VRGTVEQRDAKATPSIRFPSRGRLEHVDVLRGVAALMVCVSHLGHNQGWFDEAAEPLGHAGAYVFFVISGYLIPKVLSRESYRPSHFPSYFAKRVTRLHPPFIAALAITCILSFFAARAKHTPIGWSATDVLSQAFYLDSPDDNPVFWTLQVEMCFYIFLGVTFTLLNSRLARVRWLIFLTPCLFWPLGFHLLFFGFIPFFLIGLALEQYQRGSVGTVEFACKIAVATGWLWLFSGSMEIIVGLVVAALIATPFNVRWPRPVLWFGAISYSFYLLHFPVGMKFLHLAMGKFPHLWPSLLAVCAFVASVVAAWMLYQTVERPAMALSRKIRAPAERSASCRAAGWLRSRPRIP